MMDYNLEPKHWRSSSRHLDKDRGEFFTTRQAALALGVSPKAVASLRIRGRLPAFRRPREKRTGNGNQWWFYRKDDVYNLLADGEYLRNRDRGKRVWLQSVGAAANPTEV